MKNVTITLDEQVAKWARLWAAEHETSVSRLVGDLLASRMKEEQGYEAKMKQFLGRKPRNLSGGTTYPKRDALYDRPVLR